MSKRTEMQLLLSSLKQHHEDLLLEVVVDIENLAGDNELGNKVCDLSDAYEAVINHLTKRLEQ